LELSISLFVSTSGTVQNLPELYRHGTGKTILDQIQLVRMESARNLLVSTDNSVSVIAAKIGYSSDTYFHKIFKQEHALTPLDYRKKERGE
ncbi:MAG: AraC family transcriptional regulator, partial [Oscillospiraceae bacterium]